MQKKVENILKIQCPFSETFKEERKRQEIIQLKPNRKYQRMQKKYFSVQKSSIILFLV